MANMICMFSIFLASLYIVVYNCVSTEIDDQCMHQFTFTGADVEPTSSIVYTSESVCFVCPCSSSTVPNQIKRGHKMICNLFKSRLSSSNPALYSCTSSSNGLRLQLIHVRQYHSGNWTCNCKHGPVVMLNVQDVKNRIKYTRKFSTPVTTITSVQDYQVHSITNAIPAVYFTDTLPRNTSLRTTTNPHIVTNDADYQKFNVLYVIIACLSTIVFIVILAFIVFKMKRKTRAIHIEHGPLFTGNQQVRPPLLYSEYSTTGSHNYESMEDLTSDRINIPSNRTVDDMGNPIRLLFANSSVSRPQLPLSVNGKPSRFCIFKKSFTTSKNIFQSLPMVHTMTDSVNMDGYLTPVAIQEWNTQM